MVGLDGTNLCPLSRTSHTRKQIQTYTLALLPLTTLRPLLLVCTSQCSLRKAETFFSPHVSATGVKHFKNDPPTNNQRSAQEIQLPSSMSQQGDTLSQKELHFVLFLLGLGPENTPYSMILAIQYVHPRLEKHRRIVFSHGFFKVRATASPDYHSANHYELVSRRVFSDAHSFFIALSLPFLQQIEIQQLGTYFQ